MPKPIIAFPCTAQELESALHRVCDHDGLWQHECRLVLDKNRNVFYIEIETEGGK